MIRSKTTLVVGAGAASELELPDGADLLVRISQSFDFQRLGTDLQTPDMVALATVFEKVAPKLDTKPGRLQQAAQTIRMAARVCNDIEAILEQHGHDPLVQAAGRLAIVYFTLQAEAASPLDEEPRDPGDLPLRGTENWLYHFARTVVNGVPRAKAENCFDNLSIINFGYDRSIEHYLPWVLQMSFGMSLGEAQALVAEKLNVVHPFGQVGRLPWQKGNGAATEWGAEKPAKFDQLAACLHNASARMDDRTFKQTLRGEMAKGRRLAFLGYDFQPLSTAMLFEQAMGHNPDVLVALPQKGMATPVAVAPVLKRTMGVSDDSLLCVNVGHPWRMLRDFALFLES